MMSFPLNVGNWATAERQLSRLNGVSEMTGFGGLRTGGFGNAFVISGRCDDSGSLHAHRTLRR
jgi:hypothetical protein